MTVRSEGIEATALLALDENQFDEVKIGILHAYGFDLFRSGGLYIQYLDDGEIIKLEDGETVDGLFKFCRFVDALKG
ncbi:MAG: hypothetical protein AAF571_10485 [Verrucomicrobiota bacterium]